MCTGGKDVEDVDRSIRTLVKILGEANIEVERVKLTIEQAVFDNNGNFKFMPDERL